MSNLSYLQLSSQDRLPQCGQMHPFAVTEAPVAKQEQQPGASKYCCGVVYLPTDCSDCIENKAMV